MRIDMFNSVKSNDKQMILQKQKCWALFIAIFCCLSVNGQSPSTSQDYTYFRNFQQSISVAKQSNSFLRCGITEYGKVLFKQAGMIDRYIYQGQDNDKDLDLYFFPARNYSSKNKRFQQVDPKSQYFSPYVYVQSDPVNYIDLDGKTGKLLFFYSKDHSTLGARERAISDLMDAVPDAYHYPISDFMNKNIPELPNWDGNVFVISHSTAGSPNLIAEEGNYSSRNIYRGEGADILKGTDGTYVSNLDARSLGNG